MGSIGGRFWILCGVNKYMHIVSGSKRKSDSGYKTVGRERIGGASEIGMEMII